MVRAAHAQQTRGPLQGCPADSLRATATGSRHAKGTVPTVPKMRSRRPVRFAAQAPACATQQKSVTAATPSAQAIATFRMALPAIQPAVARRVRMDAASVGRRAPARGRAATTRAVIRAIAQAAARSSTRLTLSPLARDREPLNPLAPAAAKPCRAMYPATHRRRASARACGPARARDRAQECDAPRRREAR